MKFRKRPAPEARHRGPNPKLVRMSLEEIRKEYVLPMKFLARKRSPRMRIISK